MNICADRRAKIKSQDKQEIMVVCVSYVTRNIVTQKILSLTVGPLSRIETNWSDVYGLEVLSLVQHSAETMQ